MHWEDLNCWWLILNKMPIERRTNKTKQATFFIRCSRVSAGVGDVIYPLKWYLHSDTKWYKFACGIWRKPVYSYIIYIPSLFRDEVWYCLKRLSKPTPINKRLESLMKRKEFKRWKTFHLPILRLRKLSSLNRANFIFLSNLRNWKKLDNVARPRS